MLWIYLPKWLILFLELFAHCQRNSATLFGPQLLLYRHDIQTDIRQEQSMYFHVLEGTVPTFEHPGQFVLSPSSCHK